MLALILLLSCSDFFFSAANWTPGLRGMPSIELIADGLSVRSADDADDMLYDFPRPLLRSEKPFVRLWVWIPELPPSPGNYFGFRVTITDQYQRLVWPGIFVGRNENGSPWFFSRVLVDTPIAPASTGWWTLALGWRDDGLMEFYVSAGRVEHPTKVAQDDSSWPTYMESVSGHFIALRNYAPVFILNALTVDAILPMPSLIPSLHGVTLTGGYPTEPYELESSPDLASWSLVALLANGELWPYPDGFYRITLD